jgi:hypothetical protein
LKFWLLPGFDLLISRNLSDEIKNQLKPDILKQVERKLFFENGMSIKLSMEHFEIFHQVLKRSANFELEKFENECIKKVIQIGKSKNNFNIKIVNKKLSAKIFDFYGDPETRKILQCIMGQSQTVSEILKNSGVLKSPGYRKIENLLLYGLILDSGKIITTQKKVSQYRCIFDQVYVVIKKNDLFIEGFVSPKIFNESSITKIGIFD